MNRPEQVLLYLLPGNAAEFKLDTGSGLTPFLTLLPVLPEGNKFYLEAVGLSGLAEPFLSFCMSQEYCYQERWLMDAEAGVSSVL